MKAQILVVAVDPTEYTHLSLRDLEPVLTPDEKEAAQVKGWLLKGVEVGGDEVYGFRIPADHASPEVATWIFEAVEVETSGVVARGWVRAGQTSGSVEASVTFQASEVRKVERQVVLAEHQARQRQAKEDGKTRKAQRDAMTALRAKVEARLKGVAEVAPAGKGK
jgi:hypothetical protein